MNISQIKDSKFLKKDDCGKGILVTIDTLSIENVAMSGEPEEKKYALHFREDLKPMVLNSTNAKLIAHILGSEETDDWKGRQVVLYCDPTIMFAGKMIGGIRVRAPRPQPTPVTAQQSARPMPMVDPGPAEEEDDVPF